MAHIILHENGIAPDVRDAAYNLTQSLNDALSEYNGKIWLIPSIETHAGTGIHDIDLLMLGYLENYFINEIANFQDIEIKSFCTSIEIKSHCTDSIRREGTHLWVCYENGDKDVTSQSQKQKETLKKFLHDALQYKDNRIPYITNVIWLTGTNQNDFDQYVCLPNSNIITADSSVTDLFCAIGRQQSLRDQGYVDAFRGFSQKDIEHIANIFCKKSEGADTMTLRRINILHQSSRMYEELENRNDNLIVLSGHAGTGKTIMLLHAANILSQKGYKCLFLTYNLALISDLKHTMNFMHITGPEIDMKSMHAFMINILYNKGLWNNSYTINKNFRPAMATLNSMKEELGLHFNYDYIFVDEAQDWEKPVPEVLKYIFKDKHLVIADGIDQFMQASEHTDWGNPFIPPLKKCLRQRRNLTIFNQIFANKLGVYWNVEPNNNLPGGQVLIYNSYNATIHNQLLKQAKEHGCTEYDLMLLASNSLIQNGRFSLMKSYSDYGIHLFDGILNNNVVYTQENTRNKESRVYTYESCRGLEAWCTVCLRFDELFTQPHSHDYSQIEYDAARRYMLTLWTLIPLTRAIDTLVLIVNPDTKISELLKGIAEEYPDFVKYIQ